jgi:NADPH2:quinone reductase
MPHAIRIHAHGGPEVLRWEDVVAPVPGRGEILIRQSAVGLNLIDVYERTGLYPGTLPMVLGHEGAGVVEAVGPGVRDIAVGNRVAYAARQAGSYAQERVLAADRALRIPDGVSDRLAASAMLKGLTAWCLLQRTYRVRKGTVVVIHAAAGGVGLILSQWARHLGALVIGVTGSDAKAAVARKHGCHHVLVSGRDDLASRVRELSDGQGAHVVYDSVGKDTFFASLDALRPLGMMVSFGNASGPAPPVAPLELARRGSLFLTRPLLFHYTAPRAVLQQGARALFDVIGRGVVRIEIGQTYALEDAAQAHRDLENRRTIGSSVLLP